MKTLEESQLFQKLFLISFTFLSIIIIGVLRHGTTLLYIMLWLYVLFLQGNSLHTLKTSLRFAYQPPFAFLSSLMLLSCLSSFWSILPKQTLMQSAQNILTVASFAIFFAALLKNEFMRSTILFKSIVIIFYACLLVLLIQILSNHTIRSLYDGSARCLKPNVEILALLFFPLLGFYLYRKKFFWSGVAFVGILVATYLVEIRTSFIALIIGAVGSLLFYIAPRIMTWALAILTFLYSFTLPLICYIFRDVDFFVQLRFLPQSFHHRLYMWRYVTEKIAQKPWLGWGTSVSHNFPTNGTTVPNTNWDILPSHPHNYIMQIWLENGLLGIILLVCFQSALILQLKKQSSRLTTSLMAYYFIAILMMLSISHSFWHKWWVTWIALCGGLLISSKPQSEAVK